MLTDVLQFAAINLDMMAMSVGIVGSSITATLALSGTHASDRQWWSDVRWRQANTAREMLDGMFSNPRVRNALIMLDCEGRRYEMSPGRYEIITHADMRAALRNDQQNAGSTLTRKEMLVRDCFDRLLDALGRLEHALGDGSARSETAQATIRFGDIRGPLQYWVKVLARYQPEVTAFARAYGYERALKLLRRFPEWETPPNREAQPRKTRPNAVPRTG